MNRLSRREFLESLVAASAAAAAGCTRKGDAFAREQVCIHIFHPLEFIPAPLLEPATRQMGRNPGREYFHAGLPELAICTTPAPLLASFQYFWPFSRDDLRALEKAIEVRYQSQTIDAASDLHEGLGYLRQHRAEWKKQGLTSAVIFTWNDFTRQWCPQVVSACRETGVEELVLLKDPTLPPYLCDYPAKQRGFKRPPP